jgi:Na+/H+ antiporter NhaD/arsenite permease-like protein
VARAPPDRMSTPLNDNTVDHGLHADGAAVVMLPSARFLLGCAILAVILLIVGRATTLPVWLLAVEVFATVLGLFVFGSFRYQIHKNTLTYGMVLIVIVTFSGLSSSEWHREIAERGWSNWARAHLLTFHGWDELIHADTMLFILGLTFFVSVIAQTRLLEGITFFLLRKFRGSLLHTVIAVTAVVAFASGILDGVSMIGLTIRTLVIILLLAAAPTASMRHAVMVCTAVTTICGIWLAYGEPPNLIMKANLHPYLGDGFFLRYCAPAAVASYLVIAWRLRRKLGGEQIDLAGLDIIDAHAEDVRFLQAARHGEVLSSIGLIEEHEELLAEKASAVQERLRSGESLGIALVHENVPEPLRTALLGHFVSEELAPALDRHYVLAVAGDHRGAREAETTVRNTLQALAGRRRRAQRIGVLALVLFIAMLGWHGINHELPLFLASFAGFSVAILGIANVPRMRALAVKEAKQEFAEYYFLLPLFLSIALLTKAGFFDHLQNLIHQGIEVFGYANIAFAQFIGCTFLSAILDNNVVADFASRALHRLDLAIMYLFAMSQIAGYALGGCWTHIGSAQSVVAFAFIRREVDEHFTPVQWIREMTPLIVQVLVVLTVIIYAESALLSWLH